MLVFDGDCGFCTWAANWIGRVDRRQRVRLIACQDPTVRDRTQLARSDCLAAAWAVEPSGQRYRGAGAINAALAYALDTSLFLDLYALRPIAWLEDLLYLGLAFARRWLPGTTPYCQQHPERCRRGTG